MTITAIIVSLPLLALGVFLVNLAAARRRLADGSTEHPADVRPHFIGHGGGL